MLKKSYSSHLGTRTRLRRGGNRFCQDSNDAQSAQTPLRPTRHAGQLFRRSPLGGPLHLPYGGSQQFLLRNGRTGLSERRPAKPANGRLTRFQPKSMTSGPASANRGLAMLRNRVRGRTGRQAGSTFVDAVSGGRKFRRGANFDRCQLPPSMTDSK
jgi:hypothetical protein